MTPTLYYFSLSPASWIARLTAKKIGLLLDLKHVNLGNAEHLAPDFLEVNPQHCLPTMVDKDLVLWERQVKYKYLK